MVDPEVFFAGLLIGEKGKKEGFDVISSLKQDLFKNFVAELEQVCNVDFDEQTGQIRKKLKESFYEFFKYFWDVIVKEPLVENWHLKVICDEIQRVMTRVFLREKKDYDLIINIPPGTTKSTITSIMLPAWAWTQDPSLRFITGSYSSDLAMEMSVKTRDLILSDKYQRLFPFVQVSKDQNTKMNYKLTMGGQRFATSTGGTVTGVHAHVIIIDDPLDPRRAVSDAELKNANHWLTQTLSTRKVDKEITPMILIMQRLAEDDPTGHMVSNKQWKTRHVCLPCDDSWPIEPRKYAVYYKLNKGLLDPKRLSRKVLDEYKGILGPLGYAGQFGQQPVPMEGGVIKRDWLRYYNIDEIPRFERIVQSWDTAFKAGESNDFSVCTVWGETIRAEYYLLEVVRGRFEFPELEMKIKEMYNRWKPIAILIEDKASGQSIKQVLSKRTNLPIIGIQVPSNKSKLVRASMVAPLFEAGKVLLPKNAPWLSTYIEELLKFPNSKYDDQVDSTSQFLAWAQQSSISSGRDLS